MKQDNKIEFIDINELIPYAKNPRNNDNAVEVVLKSIKEFGFINPIIIDENNIIVAGHTRYKAAKKLRMKEVPTIKISNLTPEKINAFRIMDNKSSEYSEWEIDLLKEELNSLEESKFDLDMTGFDVSSREIINMPKELSEVPDVELQGALKIFKKVIVIIGLENDEDEIIIKKFLRLAPNRKTIKSTDFMEIINENSNSHI